MSLKKYQTKRHFKLTPEPKGKINKKSEHIFVVQKHAASHLHYDFRLAINGVLKSWAIPKGPCLDPSVKRLAVEVEDHPLEYATFEGEIPQHEYGAGSVIVWDYGVWVANDNLEKAYYNGSMNFELQGSKLKGHWHLVKLNTATTKPQWLLMKAQDEYAKKLNEYDVIDEDPASVLSNKKLQLEKKPQKLKREKVKKKESQSKIHSEEIFSKVYIPQLATLSTVVPQGDQWIYETKFDGYRILAYVNKDNVRLITRNNQDWSNKFPTIVTELSKLNLSFTVLDGEVVVLDNKNISDFQSLQNILTMEKSQANLHFFLFDLLVYQEKEIMSLSLIERKKILKKLINHHFEHIHYTEHLEGDANILLKSACKAGLEGIMAKDKNSTYQQARTQYWLKLKCHQRQEFVVVGYTEPAGIRKYFGALLIAYYENNGQLKFAGHVGTGFNYQSLKMLYEKLVLLEQDEMPLLKKPHDPLLRNIHWVKPELIIEVEFTSWTRDGILRHPSYRGLRMDKLAQEITQEIAINPNKNINFKISHPNKVLFRDIGITKQDLAIYYEKISNLILPFIKNRPLTLLRCPTGTQKKCFLQKNWTTGLPHGLNATAITDKKDNPQYISLNDKEGLIDLAQISAIEIHPWASINNALDYPDQMIFDLDPDKNTKWQDLITAANILHQALDKLNLNNYIKLTGGKGMHVVIPLNSSQNYDKIKQFSKLMAQKLSKYYPALFIDTMNKMARKNKIFIDYLRNEKEATAVSPFSPRHDENASIAVPISWDKLNDYKNSKHYSIRSIDVYLKDYPKNPWEDFFHSNQTITEKHFIILNNM